MSEVFNTLDLYTVPLTLSVLNKIPHPLLIFSQSDYLIQVVDTNSHTSWQCRSRLVGFFRSQLIWIYTVCKGRIYLCFFVVFFYLGFMALSRIFHLYRADRSSKVGENRRTWRKTTWPSVSRTWLSHIWPEPGSNHSGEKPNGLRVNSLIH